MKSTHKIRMTGLVYGLSSALDLVSKPLVNHHRQVFGFALKIADAIGVDDGLKRDIGIAALLHDIGVVAFNDGIDLEFDDAAINHHAELGYRLIRDFAPFRPAAEMVRRHHFTWNTLRKEDLPYGIRLGSSIVHLADRIAQGIDRDHCALGQSEEIRRRIGQSPPGFFMPGVVEAFVEESGKEFFWLDANFASISPLSAGCPLSASDLELDLAGLKELSAVFSRIIDYRSRHTATHSLSVARISDALAGMLGFNEEDCGRVHVAGSLHDLGKLALPPSILDKPGALDLAERNLVKSHAYHTYRILREIEGLGDIDRWAGCHHEALDGSGYPFRLSGSQIPLGARIVAVADTFAALSEHRPYRAAMPREACLRIMRGRALDNKLDPQLVGLVVKHYGDFHELAASAQREGLLEYQAALDHAHLLQGVAA
jgi:HD-GYP domain-containing protein (c-di-GMP phosphodiesterase class II)